MFLCLIPPDKAVLQQVALDCLNGSLHTRVVRRQEAHQRQHQQARIKLLRAEVLREGVTVCVKAPVADFAMYVRTQLTPSIDWTFQAVPLDGLHRAIERDPCHDFRMGEMTAWAAHLPDAFVRLAPGMLKKRYQRLLKCPRSPDRARCQRGAKGAVRPSLRRTHPVATG